MSPAEIILLKNLVSSSQDMDSSAWDKVRAGIKDRAFFSSRVESVRFLDVCRSKIADLLGNVRNSDGALTSRAEVVSSIMRAAREAGITSGSSSISDPGSEARANVIIDTNAGLAAGYARLEMDSTLGARIAFPCYELVRVEERNVPRDWRSKWVSNGGRLYQGRMVALKDDPIWTAISRFGCPYPPFDYNSGMGLDDVSHEEAVSLGVIKEDYEPQEKSPLEAFNANLEADLKADQSEFEKLQNDFGDQIRLENGKLRWRQEVFRDAFNAREPFDIKLGCATPSVFERVPDSDLALVLRDTPLVVTQKWLNAKRRNGVDHRDHFKYLPDEPGDIPLTLSDVELLPSIWREPDRVEKVGQTRIMLSMKASDGGTYKAVVDCGKEIAELKTFYKVSKDK